MPSIQVPETFLPDADYRRLIDDIMNAHDSFDHRSRVIELLGEVVNVWPELVLRDRADALSRSGIPGRSSGAEKMSELN